MQRRAAGTYGEGRLYLRNLRKLRPHIGECIPGQAFDNLLGQAGLQLPDHLTSRSKRWASFFLVAISSAFAAGPIASWPTLQPLLIKEGVFAGPHQDVNLAEVYSLASGFSMIATFVGGIIYDAMGPRNVSVLGSFGACASLVVMAISIKVQSLNYLLWFAYPAASFFGLINSFGCYAWLWLLPDEQNSVNACTGAIQALSDSFVLVAVLLHSYFGLQLPVYFFLSAALAFIAGIIACNFVPTRLEIVQITALVVSPQSGENYGSVEPNHAGSESGAEEQPCCSAVWSSMLKLKQTLVCFGLYPGASLLFIMFQVFQYMSMAGFWFGMYSFYCELMGKEDAAKLVNIWGGLYAVMGALMLLLLGRFTDWAGFLPTFALVNIPAVAFNALVLIPSMHAQIGAQMLIALLCQTWCVFVPAFCLAYAPPELFGTMSGLFGTFLGIGQMALTPSARAGIKAFQHHFHHHQSKLQAHLLTFQLWGSLTVVTSAMLLMYWSCFPMPAQGSITMADIDGVSAKLTALDSLPDADDRICMKRSDGHDDRPRSSKV